MKQILLSLTVLSVFLSFGQSTIKGTISDANGNVPFSNVIIKHSNKGVLTDDKGHFTIEAKSTDTLQISNLGYRTKEIVVGKQKDLQIVLNDYESLETVVVVAYEAVYCRKTIRCGTTRVLCDCYVESDESQRQDNSKKGNAVKMFPNPSRDGIFNLKTTDDVSDVNVVVADLSGRIILEETYKNFNSTVSVDLSNQPSGLYIINLQSSGKTIASKKAIRI
ncbi:carboxypeptidase-like regulatory domain-containing protein [uncultured Psychroserpens sp.]|uniref:carboxypeptidase-like regulatory domain-containing protein n=1 Tax=uncultured Psychroserpens sp. TaxID=255436 RepID=UPI0026191EFE|nr:carboxypeptidase-like regulatory domain-containing protein [uncultured Psychroserpens sp.]